MGGVSILNIVPACNGIVVGWIAFGIMIVSLGLLIASIAAEWDENLAITFIVICLFSLLFTLGGFTSTHAQRYEVSLSEDTDMQEFLERYTVVEQRGQIYTVEDKS